MEKIIIKGLEFSYTDPFKKVFEELSMEIDTTWKTIVVGKNGVGKSTLLKLLGDELSPDGGRILSWKHLKYFTLGDFVEQGEVKVLNLIKNFNGKYLFYEKEIERLLSIGTSEALEKYYEIEDEYRQINGYNFLFEVEREIERIGFPLDILKRDFKSLSGGEKTRIKLISLFLKKNIVPLIDEPTNHLDFNSREKIANYLKNINMGFLCVSHDRNFPDTIGDHILFIHSKKRAEVFNGKFSEFYRDQEKIRLAEISKNQRLKSQINKLESKSKEYKDWGKSRESKKRGSGDSGFEGARAAKLMKRALVFKKRSEAEVNERRALIQNLEKEYEIIFKNNFDCPPIPLVIEKLRVFYKEKQVIKNLSFNVVKGERVAIIGKNGAGKSTVIKSILNQISHEGKIVLDNRCRISYLSQEDKNIDIPLKRYLIDNFASMDIDRFASFLGNLGLTGDSLNKKMTSFSQGELRKVHIAIGIISEANFFIWDEPLNFLDLETRIKLEDAILKYKPTMLFVDHDMAFVERVATRIIKLETE